MSSQQHYSDTLGHQPLEHSYNSATSPSSPTRAYFPPSKTTTTTTTASIPQALSAASLVASLASKKAAYINHPSIQKVIASHTTKQQEANSAPGYYDDDDTIANIPDLDLLPPPPVYDIVNCSTSQTLLLVSSLINTILAVNDRLACPKITLFHSRAIPNISIEAYLSRILQYAPFQNEVLLIILLYFDRIGGGCKPTQVLTNTIPKSLLRQASLSSEEISQLTAPKTESVGGGEYFRSAAEEKAKQGGRGGMTTSDADNDILDEEEPIADEIYTSSSESPVGSKLIINSFNIHRLLITSILVACKFSSDVFYPNVRYARVGGLPLSELNQLELEFLFLSQFELNTTESELQTYGNKLLMYHQRMNGTERAAYDAITPAKGEYVRLVSEKKPIIADVKTAPPPMPPRIQTSDLTQPQSQAQPQHRPSTDSEPRPFVSTGPYRDSKEYIMDDDEIMSEKADDQVGSPADWRSATSTPVIKAETPVVAAKYPIPRSSKMNLDHMIWPTNEMETKYTAASHYGGMAMDEDAARIEEEFNKASPPPESSEPNPKRKLQRLSSGTMEPVPAKRANTPGKNNNANNNNNTDKAAGSQQGSNKNILKPLLRKIASFAHRSEAAPVQEPEPSPQPPALRSHPYLVRHRISPASSSTNLQDSEEVTSPVTPTSSRRMSWQQQQDEYSDQNHQGQMRPPSTFQSKPPPPPYSGQNQMAPYKASSASTRGRRQHRSREPSLSSLASELTFEPTRSSLSPMCEEPPRQSMSSAHPATLAPFYFPPRPQSIQGESGHPLSPLRGPQQSNASPEDEEDKEMQCDEPFFPTEASRGFQSEPLSASVAAVAAAAQGRSRKAISERIVTEGLNEGASSSSAPASSVSPPTATHQQRTTEHTAPSAGRQRIPRHAPSPTTAYPPPVQYPHPHYVASYYHPAPNLQLVQDFEGLSATTTSTTAGGVTHQNVVPIPRNPQAVFRGPQAILPAVSSPINSSSNSRSPPAPALAPRPSRQFAPIRPRTPMMQQQQEEDSKDRVARSSTETSSSSSTSAPKKKRGSESKSSTPQTPQALRPLVPAITNAPPPYRPPFIAYPSPYTPHMHRIPHGGTVRSHHPPPMIMAVNYSHGAGMVAAAGGHGHQHFIAAAGPHPHGQHYPGGPPRLFIPVIPVMYNKPPPQLAPAIPSGKAVAGSGKTTTTPAKIAPRLHQ